MNTTTEKPSILDDLKKQAGELAEKIKKATQEQLDALHSKLQDAHKTVESITAQIHELRGTPPPGKRGRKAGSKNKAKKAPLPAKITKKVKGKRGTVGAAIAAHVAKAGKKGAHVSEIAKALGMKKANVTQYFYSPGGKANFKNLGKATYAAK